MDRKLPPIFLQSRRARIIKRAEDRASIHGSTELSLGYNEDQFNNGGGKMYNATGKSMQFNGAHFSGNVFFGERNEESENEIVEKCRNWLLGNRINERYSNYVRKRYNKTCDWILKNGKFESWRSPSSAPKMFWIHGPAGFGKTVLCARIIEHITQQEEIVAHYFFSSDLESHRDPMVAMQSWIYHMSLKNESVANIVNRKRKSGPASQTVIIELFRQAIKMVHNCTLVIDGLNECAPDSSCLSVAEFLKVVNEAVRDTDTRVLVMSRPEPHIRRALREVTSAAFSDYAVSEKDVHSDIEEFSKRIVAEKLRDESPTVQNEVARKMIEQSEGQFLWLKLQQDTLREGLSQKDLRNELGEIPASFSSLYSRSWKTITQKKDRARAIFLLRLVMFSFRPLTVREISEAVLVSDEFPSFSVRELLDSLNEKNFKEKILDVCCSILEVRQQSAESPIEEWTIHPVHFTVKEFYLRDIMQQNSVLMKFDQSDSLRIAAEHGSLAELCLKYMNDPYARQGSGDDRATSSNSFTKYATEFWLQHNEAGMAQQTQQRNDLIEQFFNEKSLSWTTWKNWFDSTHGDWVNAKNNRGPTIPLCYAIELGFVGMAMDKIKKGKEREKYNSGSRTVLGVACSKGYQDLARELLSQGAKVGTKDAHGRTAVFYAIMNGNLDLVKLLITKGAEVKDNRDGQGRTAVYYAAMNGRSELVKLLVEMGADINNQDDNGVSPFLAASFNGYLDTMRRLIQKGTNIHQLDKYGNGALFKASSNGHLKAARFLIEKGVHLQLSSYTNPPVFEALKSGFSRLARLLVEQEKDPNATSGTKRLTILHVAISEGKTDIVMLLIERGADLTLQDADERTPLFIACQHGYIEIVKLLIANEVDITTPDIEQKTPLYAACANGHLNVARLLVFEHGADFEGSKIKGYTPLFGAALGGSLEIVQMLIGRTKKAADVSAIIRDRAILAASQEGYAEILRVLLEWIGEEIGSLKYKWTINNVTVECNIRDTALLLASDLGHDHVVALLLERGANVSVIDPRNRTALYAACCKGHLEVAKLLIEARADVMAIGEEAQTPLMAACASGCLDLVEELLDKGAVVNTVNIDEMGAAFAAAQCGRLEVLELLLSKGADIFCKNGQGMLPIHAASKNGHTKTVDFLIDNGSDVTVANYDGETPLWLASLKGNVDVASVLLKHGVDVDARDTNGRASLLIASSNGNIKLTKLLLDNCANVRIKDQKGQTPLYCASANGHLDIVKLLLDHGADMMPNNEGQIPAYVASREGHVDVLRFLVELGVDITITDNQKRTLLHASCSSGHIELTRLLLEMGADINARDGQGVSPLHSAAENDHVAIVEHLMRKGADPSIQREDGWNFVTAASSKGNTKTMEFLIEKCEELYAEQPDVKGRTPLIAACQAGHVDTARYLVKRGVNVNVAAADGTTAFRVARSNGHKEVVKLLLDHGGYMNLMGQDVMTLAKSAFKNGRTRLYELLHTYYRQSSANDISMVISEDISMDIPKDTSMDISMDISMSISIDVQKVILMDNPRDISKKSKHKSTSWGTYSRLGPILLMAAFIFYCLLLSH